MPDDPGDPQHFVFLVMGCFLSRAAPLRRLEVSRIGAWKGSSQSPALSPAAPERRSSARRRGKEFALLNTNI
jgi:hypothetical protein